MLLQLGNHRNHPTPFHFTEARRAEMCTSEEVQGQEYGG
jgi:hypothetical protein